MVLTVGAMAAGAGIYKWTMVDATLPVATPSPTLSHCESLTQQLAQVETERGAAFLIREWARKGCAPPTPTPTPTPQARTIRPLAERLPVPGLFVPTKDPQLDMETWLRRNLTPIVRLNRSLINGLLKEYISDESNPFFECLTLSHWPGVLRPDIDVDNNPGSSKWTIRASGAGCNGIETWEINDATGAIKYLGSSTLP